MPITSPTFFGPSIWTLIGHVLACIRHKGGGASTLRDILTKLCQIKQHNYWHVAKPYSYRNYVQEIESFPGLADDKEFGILFDRIAIVIFLDKS